MVDHLLSSRFPGLKWTIAQANVPQFQWDLMFDLGVANLARACWSQRQLFEVMVDFWSNHLNVTNPSDAGWHCRHDYDRTVIRAHALGRFVDMLKASAKHPAMLQYLNNAEARKYEPNENYGRELLELHTVSITGGYNERDMRNSALIMTGYTIDWNTTAFRYDPDRHYTGHVKVMNGPPNANANGYAMAMKYLEYLAHHPSTAKHIASKLCQHFISDAPPQAFVNHLAKVYLKSGTNITPVLRELFNSPTFTHSIGKKVRRPMEDVVATVRTLGLKPDASGKDAMQGLYYMVDNLGNAPRRGRSRTATRTWPRRGPRRAACSAAGTRTCRSRPAGGRTSASRMCESLLPHPCRRRTASSSRPSRSASCSGRSRTKQRNAICGFLGVSANTPLTAGFRGGGLAAAVRDGPHPRLAEPRDPVIA